MEKPHPAPDGPDQMASVAEITDQMEKIFAFDGIRTPDLIEQGPEHYEVSFIWEEEKLIVIVDRRKNVDEVALK